MCGLSAGTVPALCQETPAPQSTYTLKVQSDLVLADVVARDKKTGLPVQGLKAGDFTILENGKPQKITSFDTQDIANARALAASLSVAKHTATPAAEAMGTDAARQAGQFQNHRLIVLFFDTTSMQPDDLERAQQSAANFIEKQMQSADLVSVVSLGNTLALDQDFTADKSALLRAVSQYGGDSNQGFALGATGTTNQVEDTTSFTADESEYNDLNTDRELYAIASIAKALGSLNQKKSLIYFSGGIQRDGIENEASLRTTINTAVRNNLSIYSIDTRGLQAISPLGDATTGSLRGNAAYTGGALQNNLDANFNTQEVMATLSADTGGKAFFDSNDFAPAFTQVQNDTASYYVLGFHSSDIARDGRYRKLEVRIDRPDVRLTYRAGYYAPADFRHANRSQREEDLEAALDSDLPASDLSVYLQPFLFRGATGRYEVPVALLVPGAQIPFAQSGDRDKATLDILGAVKDAHGKVVQRVRDTVKLALAQTENATRKNIQYMTGLSLAPGTYHLKFVVRENETGKLGSFEADTLVPALGKTAATVSSVVLAAQRSTDEKPSAAASDPLVYQGERYIPDLPHVFAPGQPLYFFYEVYDPATTAHDAESKAVKLVPGVHVQTSIELLRNNVRVYATPLVQATALNVPGRNAIAFAFTVPLTGLAPGAYICQVNVVDDTGASYLFPRTQLYIWPEKAALNAVVPGSAR